MWMPIPGEGGAYEVSDEGEVRNARTGRVLKARRDRGYERVQLSGRRIHTVHLLVLRAFVGERPEGCSINHIDGCKSNNNLANLEYCTPSQNMKHAFRMGLQSNQGEKHSGSKLTDEMVRDIRRLLRSGVKQREVAKMMNVGQPAISRVNTCARWAHVAAPVAVGE